MSKQGKRASLKFNFSRNLTRVNFFYYTAIFSTIMLLVEHSNVKFDVTYLLKGSVYWILQHLF